MDASDTTPQPAPPPAEQQLPAAPDLIQQAGPPLPPRDYREDHRAVPILYIPYSPLTSPILPRFFRFLVRLVCLGSGASLLLAYLYRTYMLPKIRQMQLAYTQLYQKQLDLHTALNLALQGSVQALSALKHTMSPTEPESPPADKLHDALVRLATHTRQLTDMADSNSALTQLSESAHQLSKACQVETDHALSGLPPGFAHSFTTHAALKSDKSNAYNAVIADIRAMKGSLLTRRAFVPS